MKYIAVLLTFFMFMNHSFAQDVPLEGTQEGVELENNIQQKKDKAMGENSRGISMGTAQRANSVLFVIEGIVVDSDVLEDLEANGIEQVSILKEEKDIVAYGGDSTKEGVVVVTLTKEYKEKFKKMMEDKKE